MNGRDPGWKPALRGWWRWLIPGGHGMQIGRHKTPALVFLRSLWLSLLFQWAAFGVILMVIGPNREDDKQWTLVLPAASGLGSLAVIGWFRARTVKAIDLASLRDAYATPSFIGYSLANTPVLMGFLSCFIGGGMPGYLVGVAFGLVSFAFAAPTRTHLDRFQRKLRGSGVGLSIIDALREPLPPGERKSGWRKRTGEDPRQGNSS